MNETWTPRRCSSEYFESRAKEMTELRERRIYPWQEQQGRTVYQQWDAATQSTVQRVPLTKAEQRLMHLILLVSAGWGATVVVACYLILKGKA